MNNDNLNLCVNALREDYIAALKTGTEWEINKCASELFDHLCDTGFSTEQVEEYFAHLYAEVNSERQNACLSDEAESIIAGLEADRLSDEYEAQKKAEDELSGFVLISTKQAATMTKGQFLEGFLVRVASVTALVIVATSIIEQILTGGQAPAQELPTPNEPAIHANAEVETYNPENDTFEIQSRQ